jgi:hypothetical protein
LLLGALWLHECFGDNFTLDWRYFLLNSKIADFLIKLKDLPRLEFSMILPPKSGMTYRFPLIKAMLNNKGSQRKILINIPGRKPHHPTIGKVEKILLPHKLPLLTPTPLHLILQSFQLTYSLKNNLGLIAEKIIGENLLGWGGGATYY